MGITPDLVAADGKAPKQLAFLRFRDRVRDQFGQLRKFVVQLDVAKTKLQELSYDVQDDQLSIYITPRDGFWNEGDLKTTSSAYRYDLIIMIGAHNAEAMGDLYAKHTEFFYTTPTINIDHSPANEHHGQINVMDLTATSCAEVAMQLFEKWDHELIDEKMATCLLTGMIAKTQSFKTPTVTPKTLEHASLLMKRGARRSDIVDNLFRTRSVETLRLWGRVLARLKSDKKARVVWSVLSQQDFLHAGADESLLPDVIDELIRNSPEAEVVVLLYEDRERHVCGIISTDRALDSLELALPLKPVGTKQQAKVCLTKASILEAEQAIVPMLIQRLGDLRNQ